MNRSLLLMAAVAAATGGLARPGGAADPPKDNRCYEMRIYYAAEGKLDALQARFREHTVRLFEKHGMTNIGYWTPIDNPDRKLVYILGFTDRATRDAGFKAFGADPEWQTVAKATEADGRLVDKIESHFLQAVDFSPPIKAYKAEKPRVFELRTYTTTPGNRDRLLARFREHTVALFSKHGMGHFGYWIPQAGQKTSDNTLVYLLTHSSREAAEASFKAFRSDPQWIAARAASEKEADGSLTVENGVTSEFLLPTDYSPTQ